ncbi:hypothetical protein [Flavobacterium sp. JAS]|uniref:hypothetical protein n=1 Tax=Flavobacterium sp. JAS TaxID=2897329 RepID=UPI001E29A8D3|nr:hypothetical protein [Flavobacterium sp. JAS]MCD0472302.1 hypothetical protein [Flavobacterium sp. JAS]
MKKQFFLAIILLVTVMTGCKNNESSTRGLSQNGLHNDSAVDKSHSKKVVHDTVQLSVKAKIKENYLVNLPFNFEEKDKLSASNELKFKEVYPVLKGDKLEIVKKIIYDANEDNPDEVFQINNGTIIFDTYVYCTYGDSDAQTLINVKNGKIISIESIGYAMPENETYQSFVINKDLSIVVYDINYADRSKKILEKYQINTDGSISKRK